MKPHQTARVPAPVSVVVLLTRSSCRRLSLLLSVIGCFCTLTVDVLGAAPVAADFPELAAAIQPLEAFLAGNVVTLGTDSAAPDFNSPQACNPFPADARILAYEEHRDFLYAVGDLSPVLTRPGTAADSARPRFVRRLLHLKPNVFVLDDGFRLPSDQPSVRWTLGSQVSMTASGDRRCFSAGDQELVWHPVRPGGDAAVAADDAGKPADAVHAYRLQLSAAAGAVRLLQAFELRKVDGDLPPAAFAVTEQDGQLELAIKTAQRTVQLTLPDPTLDAGWIASQDGDGSQRIPRRPLASGVLPHGPEGVQLIERWDSAYRGDRPAGWDTGLTAPPLKDAVESGVLKPCRVIAFGCGTGTNEIYLASRGFDVTAVDVAPTALGLAAAKAQQAGVRVRWMLADVLAIPDLEPFDLVFDRGCYHHVHYVDAAGFVQTLRRLTHPGSRCLILSCNNDRPPGVREQHMRDDFSALFDFEWLRDSAIEGRDGNVRRESWSLLLRRKQE